MKSLKLKSICYVLLLIILFSLYFTVMTNIFYKDYYDYRIKKQMLDSSNKFEFSLTQLNVSPDSVIENISLINDFEAILLNENYDIIEAVNQCSEKNHEVKNGILTTVARNNVDKVFEGPVYLKSIELNELLGSVLVKKIVNDNILVLMKPNLLNYESHEIFNRFILIISLIFIAIVLPIIYYYAKRISKPINDMNLLTLNMFNNEFSTKVYCKGNTELKELSDNLNTLSQHYYNIVNELSISKKSENVKDNFYLVKMLSIVAHEFKNFLTINQGYIESLKFIHNDNPEKREKYFDIIIDESKKMYELVKNLLDINTYQLGAINVQKKIFSIRELIIDIVKNFKPRLVDQGIRIEVINNFDFMIYADYLKIEQVIKNYLNNAIAHVNELSIIKINVSKNNEKVRVSVFNTGKNINQDEIDLIWNNYYSSDKARINKGDSFGVGLAIVKYIIKLHEGNYGVINRENGVEFYIELDVINKN